MSGCGLDTIGGVPSPPPSVLTRLGRTLYVDGTQTPPTPNGSIGNPYPTITAALTAAALLAPSVADPVTIVVADATYAEVVLIASNISVTAANAAGGVCRITAPLATDTIVTLASGAQISGFRIEGASGAGGRGIAAIAANVSPFARATNCLIVDCETGYHATGAGVFLICANCIAIRPTAGDVMVDAYLAEAGAQVHGYSSRAIGASGSLITGGGFVARDAGSEAHVHAGTAAFCVNGLQAENSGVVRGYAPRLFACTNGQRLGPGASGRISTAALLGLNTTLDILVDGATSTLEMIAGEANLENIVLRADTIVAGDVNAPQTNDLDPQRLFASDVGIGFPSDSLVLGVGQGLPTNIEMMVFQYNDSAASGSRFTDVTTAARSRTGSTVGFPVATQTTDAIVIGAPRQFGGAQTNITTAMDPTGVLTWEYWDGAAWVEMPPGGSRGSGIAVHRAEATGLRYRANIAWEVVETQAIDINNEITALWASDTGTLDETPTTAAPFFWIRVRPSTLPVTFPLIEQFKIRYGSALVSPSGIVLSGTSRVRKTISINSNLFQRGTTQPTAQDIAYSADILVGLERNSYDNNVIDEAGIAIPIPFEFDLSTPIDFEVEWMPADGAAGNVEWEVFYALQRPTDILAVALPGPLTQFVDGNIQAAPAVAFQGVTSTHELRIPNGNPDDGDTLVLMVRRDASAGNPNDTYANSAIVRSFRLNGLVWRQGRSAQ